MLDRLQHDLALDSGHRDPQTLAEAMPEHLSREQIEETFNALGLGSEQDRIRVRDEWVAPEEGTVARRPALDVDGGLTSGIGGG